jgi:hypothetical protein
LEDLSGNERTADNIFLTAMPGDYGMHIIVPSVSVSYKFLENEPGTGSCLSWEEGECPIRYRG